LDFNLERVQHNATESTTEDLLDRITAYRAGMEPEAVEIIERELQDRGLSQEDIRLHAEARIRQGVQMQEESSPMCSFCRRPSVSVRIGWHRLWGLVPIFPRRYQYCSTHLSGNPQRRIKTQNFQS
jgi:hypothetical protein